MTAHGSNRSEVGPGLAGYVARTTLSLTMPQTSTRSPSPDAISDQVEWVGQIVVEAAIARAEAVNPALNALAYAAFGRGARRGRDGYGPAFFECRLIKDNADVAGQPEMMMAPTREPYAAVADSDNSGVPGNRAGVLKTQLSEFGQRRGRTLRRGPVRNPWNTDYTAGASGADGADRARQRRRRGSIRIPAACNAAGRASRRAAGCRWSRSRRLPVGTSPRRHDPHGAQPPQPSTARPSALA